MRVSERIQLGKDQEGGFHREYYRLPIGLATFWNDIPHALLF